MIKMLFDPEGRISPDDFLKSALILVAIGAVFSLLPLAGVPVMVGFVSVVLVYPWAVIWIKRLHDAGKPGWMFVIVFALWLGATIAASQLITSQFAPQMGPTPTDFSTAMALASARAEMVAVPGAIVSAVISLLFVLLGNAFLKSDPGPNAYDPPDHLR